MGGTMAYIGLGANLGDRPAALRDAVARLGGTPGITVRRVSPVYETAAHTREPGEVQPPYLNAVAEVRTDLAPEALLAACLDIERQAGRDRRQARPWAPRPLDLDLLVYGRLSCATDVLVVPHPRLAERRFVLQPLADLDPDLHVPPPFDATAGVLLACSPDPDVPVRTGLLLFEPPAEGHNG
jgi:2-amino-4-hydroxy-6-hydroxymethyldihydropteridine diphosphokinase